VTKYAQEIRDALGTLLNKTEWEQLVNAVAGDGEAEDRVKYSTGITQVVLHVICDYDFRIMQRVKSFPYLLLWFGIGLPDDPLQSRVEVAKRLLSTDPSSLQATARKILKLFRKQLQAVIASKGKVPLQLYAVMKTVVDNWPADNQELEGVMSLIKLVLLAGPTTTDKQLDARVGIVKHIGVGTTETKGMKWSLLEGRYNAAIEEAIAHHGETKKIICDPDRFAPVIPCLRDIPTGNLNPPAVACTYAGMGRFSKFAVPAIRPEKRSPCHV